MGAPSRSPSPSARSVAPDEIFFLFRPFVLFFDWLCENRTFLPRVSRVSVPVFRWLPESQSVGTYTHCPSARDAVIWYFYLRNFQVGSFQLTYPNGVTEIYGDVDNEDFRAVITVHSRAGFRRMVLGEVRSLRRVATCMDEIGAECGGCR